MKTESLRNLFRFVNLKEFFFPMNGCEYCEYFKTG